MNDIPKTIQDPDAYLRELTEAWGELIDPMESLRSDPAFFGGHAYGYHDRPDARARGDYWPHFTDETMLSYIRGAGTYIAETDPVAINIVNTLTNFGVGEGVTVEITTKPDADGDDAAWHAQRVVDEFMERTQWSGHLDGELFARTRKAGERFVHVLDVDQGYADVEIVEPSWVTEPRNARDVMEHFGRHDLAELDWKYGIATPSNRPADVKAYFVQRYGDPHDYEIVEPNRMSHIKANVETGVKRGITDFYGGAEEWINDSKKTLRNIVKGAGIQAAIAFIRKHTSGASNAAIDSAADSQVEFHTRAPSREGERAPRQIPTERFYSGKIVDSRGYDFMYGPLGTPAGPHLVPVSESGLRYAGRRWGFPEDMMTGNASSTNFASILEAHQPFLIQMKRAQQCDTTHTKETLWQVLEVACEAGRIPYDIATLKGLIEVSVSPPDIESRDQQLDHTVRKEQNERGLLSLRTWAEQEGLDYDKEQENRKSEPKLPPTASTLGNPMGAAPIPQLYESEALRTKEIAFSLLEADADD